MMIRVSNHLVSIVFRVPLPFSEGEPGSQGNWLKHDVQCIYIYMGVSRNRDIPKSSILIRFSIINHPFWGIPIFGNTHIYIYTYIMMTLPMGDIFLISLCSFPPGPRFTRGPLWSHPHRGISHGKILHGEGCVSKDGLFLAQRSSLKIF